MSILSNALFLKLCEKYNLLNILQELFVLLTLEYTSQRIDLCT